MTVPSSAGQQTSEQQRMPGRPRSEASRRAVLKAAYAILVETGLGNFSIEAVAVRSRVARTTIYRWWPTKGVLAVDSFLESFRPHLVYRPAGSATADFHALVAAFAAAMNGPAGRVAASILAQAQEDRETRQLFLERFSEPLRRETELLLRQGVDRGEFRADLDLSCVIDAAVGAVYLRLLFGQALDPDWAGDLAKTLLRGCNADPDLATPR
jgi:AcrR family transcriptional regulator